MKTTKFLNCTIGLLACCFINCFLFSCASAPAPEPKSIVTITTLNAWLKNHERKIQTSIDLNSKELMEITKLCMSYGELPGFSLLEENAILSFALVQSEITINNIPLTFRYTYSISKSGTLSMKITNVSESSEGTFKRTVNTKDLELYKEAVIKAFSNKMENVANVVVNRAADFS